MKNNKGITLIALIITIIVMLILVGVTINVALNGGLFEKTKNAKDLTQKEIEKEELISTAIGAYSSKNDSVLLSDLISAIDTAKYTYNQEKTESKENVYVVEGKKSGVLWEINLKTAEVKEYEEPVSGGNDTPVAVPISQVDYDNTTYNVCLKKSNEIDLQNMPYAFYSFYPSDLTLQQALQARKLYSIIF